MFVRLSIVCLLMYASAAQSAEGPEILQTRCGGCHQQSAPGHFARITDIRKTPEGWLMTLFRMQHVHQVQITETDRDVLIRYLADTQGLAPSETTGARYALERRPNAADMALPGDLQVICARCHSAPSIRLAGCSASFGSRLTGSAATWTSCGPMSPTAPGSAARPKAGSAGRTGSTASCRWHSCSMTRA